MKKFDILFLFFKPLLCTCSGRLFNMFSLIVQAVLGSLQTDLDSIDPADIKGLEEKVETWTKVNTKNSP